MSGKKQIQVLIATPTFRGSVASTTMSCILKVGMLFASIGVAYRFSYVDSAEIVLVRNYFGSCVMEDPAITHLLFIDDDMSFSEEAVLELLRADKMIIGCTSPRRTIDLEKLHQLGARGVPYPAALSQSLSWVTRHAKPDAVEIRDGNCLVNGIGMGVTLIRREVLDTMVAKNVVDRRPTNTMAGYKLDDVREIFGFFDVRKDKDGVLLSEDLSFCDRWIRDCGGEVWANVTQQIGHIGQMEYRGNYWDYLQSMRIA